MFRVLKLLSAVKPLWIVKRNFSDPGTAERKQTHGSEGTDGGKDRERTQNISQGNAEVIMREHKKKNLNVTLQGLRQPERQNQ